MSLILEALNRARREQHNAAPVPGVDSEHYYTSAEESPWRQRGLLGALAVALLVIGVLLSREFGRDGAEPPPAATEQPAVLAEAPVAPIVAPPVATTTAPAGGGTLASHEALEAPVILEAVPEAAPEVSTSAVTTSLPQSPPPATAGTGSRAEVAALYQQSTVTEETPAAATAAATVSASEETVDIASLVTAAEQALEDVRLAEHAAPFLGDLSQQRKDAVPTLMYVQHDYRSEGGSTVTINGQQARAGQPVGLGVKVEEILPDSAVLSHSGQQFRLRALNSWVNL